MSQVYSTAPALEIPSNSRETTVPRKDTLWLSMRLALSGLAFPICCTLEGIVISIMYLYGPRELFYIEPYQYAVITAAVCFFYFLIITLTLFFGIIKINKHGTAVAYGFTKDYFYSASVHSQYLNNWRAYARWKEVKKYFLLSIQGRWVIVPKVMWTKAEVDELRALMREKIGKRTSAPKS